MGTTFGFSEEDRTRDFPDLNKCPDCETFFADDCCPLCGKRCPEAFRAGNRKRVKQKKSRRGNSGRVIFVPWYHTTPFVIAMLVIQPLIGLILTWTGYWQNKWKTVATVCTVGAWLLPTVIGVVIGMTGVLGRELPVDTTLSEAEYKTACIQVSAEALWRDPGAYQDQYVTLTATVKEQIVDESSVDGYAVCYLCTVDAEGQALTFLIRDYRQTDNVNFLPGDQIVIWGQGGGNQTAVSYHRSYQNPGINMLYAERVN